MYCTLFYVEWILVAAAASKKRNPKHMELCDNGRLDNQKLVTITYCKLQPRLSPFLHHVSSSHGDPITIFIL